MIKQYLAATAAALALAVLGGCASPQPTTQAAEAAKSCSGLTSAATGTMLRKKDDCQQR